MEKIIFYYFTLALIVSSLQGQNVGIGTSTPNSTARLEIVDTERGLLVPRLTQVQRDAISSPAQSLLIFNLTSNCYEWWDNYSSSWIQMSCGGCVSAPSAPTANAATSITATSFTANWTSVPGATFYRLDVATDAGFTSFVTGYNNLNVGNVTSYNVTGLDCNTQYYYRLRACNDCGCSPNSNAINLTTLNSTPSAPTANSATSITDNAFTANWSSATGATSYRLDVATDAGFTSFVAGYNNLNVGNVTSYNVTGLTCNTQYYYRVRACNSCGCSGNSNVINLTTDPCPPATCTYTGGNSQDSIYSMFIQSGLYHMAGSTNSWGTGTREGWIIQVNSTFSWPTATVKAIGTASFNETLVKMIPTTDGGFIAVGHVDLGSGNIDIWVVKMNASFTPTWSFRYGGAGAEYGSSITEIAGNNFIVVGNTNSMGAGLYDGFIMRLDNMGNITWQRTFGGMGQDGFNSVITDNAGRVAVAGFTTLPMSTNIEGLAVIFNTDGTVHWQRAIGETTGPEMFFDILQDTDNGYVCAGFAASSSLNGGDPAGYENAYIVKFNNTGGTSWTRSIDGAASARLYSIIKTSDGGFVGAGITGSMGYVSPVYQDAFICKVSNTGAFSWARRKDVTAMSTPIESDQCYDIVETGTGLVFPIISNLPSSTLGGSNLCVQGTSSSGAGACCGEGVYNTSTSGGTQTTTTYTPTLSSLARNTLTLIVTDVTLSIIGVTCAN